MPAALQGVDLLERHVRHECTELRVKGEEVRLIVCAVVGAQGLVLAVDRLREAAKQRVGPVAGKQRVPIRPPQDLDNVPARAVKERLELLDDLAVAAYRSVEALQIAVDDKGQI